jgi:hypothetical protein
LLLHVAAQHRAAAAGTTDLPTITQATTSQAKTETPLDHNHQTQTQDTPSDSNGHSTA